MWLRTPLKPWRLAEQEGGCVATVHCIATGFTPTADFSFSVRLYIAGQRTDTCGVRIDLIYC